jgi:hypothetical protein
MSLPDLDSHIEAVSSHPHMELSSAMEARFAAIEQAIVAIIKTLDVYARPQYETVFESGDETAPSPKRTRGK